MTSEPFREEARYEYPLTPDSVVLDCGGYEGTFAAEISRRYNCHVHVLEPIQAFYDRTRERLKDMPKVKVHHLGIGGETKAAWFFIKGDMTGAFQGEGDMERVMLASPLLCLTLVDCSEVALLKLNIEGAEYEVLETMLAKRLVRRFRNIQVQWHSVAFNAENRREKIMAQLAETHELTFDYGWTWQNYRLKA